VAFGTHTRRYDDDEEGAHGTLPDARNLRQRSVSIELANTLASNVRAPHPLTSVACAHPTS
jgi:hypothetical protein